MKKQRHERREPLGDGVILGFLFYMLFEVFSRLF
jgi:hypothetical protein